MIAAIIRWSARNVVPRRPGHDLRNARRHLCCLAGAARCHPRPLRRAGHRLHRISRPGAAGGRGPGHLSADHGDADRAEIAGGARLLLLRRVLRLRDFRGRHRPLLGALAGARISQLCRAAAAGGRDAEPRARRDRRRLGLSIRGARRRRRASPSCAPFRTGTSASASPRPEGVAEVASVGGFVKQYSVVIDPRRLQALGIPLSKIREAIRDSNMDVGGRTVEARRDRIRGARPRLHQEPRRPRADRGQERPAACRCC